VCGEPAVVQLLTELGEWTYCLEHAPAMRDTNPPEIPVFESLDEVVDAIVDTGVDRDRKQGGRDRRQGGALRLKTGGSFWRNVLRGLFGK